MIKRAVLWLCEKTGKALLKLDNDDFRNHGLHQLLRNHGPAERVAHRVFRWMMDTINYHPAGKQTKRVICFSPHPDDDVISMGGTLIRLVEDQHEVHVAYMTSGNIAVFDHDARRVADLVTEYNRMFSVDTDKSHEIELTVAHSLQHKTPGQSDTPRGTGDQNADSLERSQGRRHSWPAARKRTCTFSTCRSIAPARSPRSRSPRKTCGSSASLIVRLNPAQIYVAGDLSDPHGTHRVCAEAIFRALETIDPAARPEVLLYRGAWQEWAPHEIEIAVPLSPHDLARKRAAIFRHESQKDSALFPGPDDSREFWQRAEERNRNTAILYNQIGLPEYFALEGFVRWNGVPI